MRMFKNTFYYSVNDFVQFFVERTTEISTVAPRDRRELGVHVRLNEYDVTRRDVLTTEGIY